MKVFDVKILSHDRDSDIFTVRYSIDKGKGVIRRSTATYFGGHLSRDNENPQILEEVEKVLKR